MTTEKKFYPFENGFNSCYCFALGEKTLKKFTCFCDTFFVDIHMRKCIKKCLIDSS